MSICTLKPLYSDCFLLPFFGHHTGGLTEQNLGLKVKPAIGQGRVGDSADDLPCRHFSHISGVNIHRGKGRGDQGGDRAVIKSRYHHIGGNGNI